MDEIYFLKSSVSGKNTVEDFAGNTGKMVDGILSIDKLTKNHIVRKKHIVNINHFIMGGINTKDTEKLEEKKIEDENLEGFASAIIFFHSEKIKKILKSSNFKLDQLSTETKRSINSLIGEFAIFSEIIVEDPNLSNNENEEIIFDDLGLPLHPLEVEVLNLVERAKKGEQIFPRYDRSVDTSVLNYLKKHYGKYLKCFGAEDDYIYQFQLEAIDSKFRDNLRSRLSKEGK